MITAIKTFFADAKGVTLIEYGLIAALLAVFLVTVLGRVGTNMSTMFNTVATKV